MSYDPRLYRALADAVLILHAGVVLFIAGGLVLTLAGALMNWQWVRNVQFRVLHLGAVAYVVVTTWFGVECGLTTLEQSLRARTGEVMVTDGFIAHWLGRLLFFDAPPWAFVVAYTAFGLLVLWSWFGVAPSRGKGADAS